MNEEKSFLDKRTIAAIVVMTVIWLGWQTYMNKKYGSGVTEVQQAQLATPTAVEAQTSAPKQTEVKLQPKPASTTATETSLSYEDEIWSLQISNYGMAVKDVELKKFKDRDGKNVKLATLSGDFGSQLIGQNEPLVFEIQPSTGSATTIVGKARVGGIEIVKTYEFESNKYLIHTTVQVNGFEPGISGVRLTISDMIKPLMGSFFMPSMEHQSAYIAHGTTSTRANLTPEGTEDPYEKLDAVSVASLGSLYFASAVVDSSEIIPSSTSKYEKINGETALKLNVDHVFPAGLSAVKLQYKSFVGPKELRLLQSIDPKFEELIDYWIVGSLAKPMLKLMLWIQTVVGNWGVAIILLTLLIRTLVLPLYVSSFKSMKAMQKIQPQMQDVRSKYANDPQKMNQEVMKLFKENKVNPIGGCLPMLLQLPIFIALYRVLSQSIELYQAPFMLWITDLSLKDPFFVLPVLMGIAMFIQQKITPMTTTDPMQQKIMLWMPVLFSAMMLTLPSGLTLYILISTVFGIIQHYIFMKDKSPAAVPAKV